MLDSDEIFSYLDIVAGFGVVVVVVVVVKGTHKGTVPFQYCPSQPSTLSPTSSLSS